MAERSLVIGGGFFGCATAIELARKRHRVTLVEAEADLMQRASYNNQARIHQGYHYPRSFLTASRSRINFGGFLEEFSDCVFSQFNHYYAIATHLSKTTAGQFAEFCKRIGAPLQPAPKEIRSLFAPHLIEDVFGVTEFAFDSVKLKNLMKNRLSASGVDVQLNTTATSAKWTGKSWECQLTSPTADTLSQADEVFNCTYANLNLVPSLSHLETVPIKIEITEMALIEVPEEFKNLGVTVMDGPFFSFMPFPPRALHTLSHVRYTPHGAWIQDSEMQTQATSPRFQLQNLHLNSNAPRMLRDVTRYLPSMARSRYVDSLWELKAVLPQSENDDSRPIVFQESEPNPGFVNIMGGKIDNIADIRSELQRYLRGTE